MYDELRTLATVKLAQEKLGQTLQATALVHEMLDRLETQDARKATLVKLRYFAGMIIHEAADALGTSTAKADNDWAYAKSWLKLQLGREAANE